MGRLTSVLTTPTTRIQGNAVWEIVQFLLNSALFVLVGLQLPAILDGLDELGTGELVRDGALIAGDGDRGPAALGVPLHVLPRRLIATLRERRPAPPWRAHAARRAGPACAVRSRSPPRSPCRSRSTAASAFPEPRADHLPHVLGDPGDAPAAGSHAAAADPAASVSTTTTTRSEREENKARERAARGRPRPRSRS